MSVQHRLASGEIRDLDVRLANLTEANQTFNVATIQDVTESNKRARLISSQAALLAQVQNGIITIGFTNTILSWNNYAQELYQWTPE